MGEKKSNMTVNPYEVKGNVDYGRLINEFGLEKIDEDILKKI